MHTVLSLQGLYLLQQESVGPATLSLVILEKFSLVARKVISIASVLSLLRAIQLSQRHCCTPSKSDCSLFSISGKFLHVEYTVTSSANRHLLDVRFNDRSLMKSMNNKGPSTDPCGIPLDTVRGAGKCRVNLHYYVLAVCYLSKTETMKLLGWKACRSLTSFLTRWSDPQGRMLLKDYSFKFQLNVV